LKTGVRGVKEVKGSYRRQGLLANSVAKHLALTPRLAEPITPNEEITPLTTNYISYVR